jgi:transposase, IS30 family
LVTGRVGIEHQPKIVNSKQRIGDLEIDLVINKYHKQAVLSINDRATVVLILDNVNSKEASVIEAKAIELFQAWKPIIKTITSGNGKEFANHKNIDNAKPYPGWVRGANENLNGLIRQYFHKKTNFCHIT